MFQVLFFNDKHINRQQWNHSGRMNIKENNNTITRDTWIWLQIGFFFLYLSAFFNGNSNSAGLSFEGIVKILLSYYPTPLLHAIRTIIHAVYTTRSSSVFYNIFRLRHFDRIWLGNGPRFSRARRLMLFWKEKNIYLYTVHGVLDTFPEYSISGDLQAYVVLWISVIFFMFLFIDIE